MTGGDGAAWLRGASLLFFYSYVGLLVGAGAEGMVFGRVDQSVLLGLHLDQLPHRVQADVMSQYRFLRGIELAFGVFAVVHRRDIYADCAFNRLFLFGMAAGLLGRALALPIDGSPDWWMYGFGIWELAGVIVIFAHTRTTVVPQPAPAG